MVAPVKSSKKKLYIRVWLLEWRGKEFLVEIVFLKDRNKKRESIWEGDRANAWMLSVE